MGETKNTTIVKSNNITIINMDYQRIKQKPVNAHIINEKYHIRHVRI